MKIDEILASKLPTSSGDLFLLQGEIEPDQDLSRFRLYTTPLNKRNFFLIDKGMVDEIYRWTPEESAHAGFAGHAMYTVPLKYGSVIQSVALRNITIGAPTGGGRKGSASGDCSCGSSKKSASTRNCNYSASCANNYPDAPCLDGDICDACCVT